MKTNRRQEYESFLASIKLYPELKRIEVVEVDLKGQLNPTILLDDSFFQQGKWIDFEAFRRLYTEKHRQRLEILRQKCYNGISVDEFWLGVKARLYRTFLGFLTEYHAYFMAVEVFGEQRVKRGVEIDKLGVDFQVLHSGDTYNIHVFVDTPRAWEYRMKKMKGKSSDRMSGIHVNLPYTLEPGKISSVDLLQNGFGIFTRRYIEYLKAEIEGGRLKEQYEQGGGAS